VQLFADAGVEGYPGDVINMFHAIAGNKVVVAWPSRFCGQGQPNYSMDSARLDWPAARAVAEYLDIDLSDPRRGHLPPRHVRGGRHQGTVDYLDDKWEQNHPAGEVPFACCGPLAVNCQRRRPPHGGHRVNVHARYNTERLTSGVRDVNRIERSWGVEGPASPSRGRRTRRVSALVRARPGEGWSGAIANSKTDVSVLLHRLEDFSVVQDPTDDTGATPMTLEAYEAAAPADITQKPKPFVPMAMPMRLTDNEKCNVENRSRTASARPMPSKTGLTPATDYGLKDMCMATIQVPTGQQGTLSDVCVDETGLPNIGNTAATRPRIGLYAYDSADGLDLEGGVRADGVDVDRDAFAVIVAEEDKGLGKFGFYTDDDGDYDLDAGLSTLRLTQIVLPSTRARTCSYHSFGMGLTYTVV
jgi:hypothetical protein